MTFFTRPGKHSVLSIFRRTRLNSTTAIMAAGLFLSLLILYYFTPWPSALSYRYTYNRKAVAADKALADIVPRNVISIRNIQYDLNDDIALLDIYLPPQVPVGKKLPVIVWMHGGDWIAGSRLQIASYCKLIAARGYVVVAPDYSLAPEKHYPVPLMQMNSALQFMVSNADRFSADMNRIFLAGNDAGALMAMQLANISVNSNYSRMMNIKPAVNAKQIAGCILYNGMYDISPDVLKTKENSHLETALWSYSRSRQSLKNEAFKSASVVKFLNAGFPPCYIASSADERFMIQAEILSAKLKRLNSRVTTCFGSDDFRSRDEYFSICNLEIPAGQKTFTGSLAFIGRNLP